MLVLVLTVCVSLLANLYKCETVSNMVYEITNVMNVGDLVVLEVDVDVYDEYLYFIYDSQTAKVGQYSRRIEIENLFPYSFLVITHATTVTRHPEWPKANNLLIVIRVKEDGNGFGIGYITYKFGKLAAIGANESQLPNWGLKRSAMFSSFESVDQFWPKNMPQIFDTMNGFTFYSKENAFLVSNYSEVGYDMRYKVVKSDNETEDWLELSSESPTNACVELRSLFVMSDQLYAFGIDSKYISWVFPVNFRRINGDLYGIEFLEREKKNGTEFFVFLAESLKHSANSEPPQTETPDGINGQNFVSSENYENEMIESDQNHNREHAFVFAVIFAAILALCFAATVAFIFMSRREINDVVIAGQPKTKSNETEISVRSKSVSYATHDEGSDPESDRTENQSRQKVTDDKKNIESGKRV